MRWYGQVGIAAVLGLGAYGISQNWGVVQTYLPGPVLGVLKPLFPGAKGPEQASGPGRSGAPSGGQGPVVEVVPVVTGVVTETTEAVGTTRAFESIVINAKISGMIEAVLFTEGANVEKGQELVRIDGAERKSELEAAKAAITQEEAKRNELRTKLDRAIQLRKSGAGTEALVDDLQAQVKTSDSAIQNALAKERGAQARMNDVVVRAPFSGRVGIRQVSVGTYLDTRTTITTLDDISKVRLDFQIPENLLARIKVGAPVKTTSTAFGDRKFEGQVAVIDTRIEPTTRSVKLTALIDNPDQSLRPGMFLNATLEVAKRPDAVMIPEEAIVGEGPLQIAFVVKDSKVERRILQVGQRDDGKVEVLKGVAPGEPVVVRGLHRVRAGLIVQARPLGSVPPQSQSNTPTSQAPARAQPQAGQIGGVNAAQAAPAPVPGQPQTARP